MISLSLRPGAPVRDSRRFGFLLRHRVSYTHGHIFHILLPSFMIYREEGFISTQQVCYHKIYILHTRPEHASPPLRCFIATRKRRLYNEMPGLLPDELYFGRSSLYWVILMMRRRQAFDCALEMAWFCQVTFAIYGTAEWFNIFDFWMIPWKSAYREETIFPLYFPLHWYRDYVPDFCALRWLWGSARLPRPMSVFIFDADFAGISSADTGERSESNIPYWSLELYWHWLIHAHTGAAILYAYARHDAYIWLHAF